MKRLLTKLIFFSAIVSFICCQKNPYIDTGVFKNDYKGTTMDFLESRPELFDTLVRVIKHSKIDTDLDKQGRTYFAPANRCIRMALQSLKWRLESSGRKNITKVEDIDAEIWKDFLGIYLFDGVWMANDIPQLDENDLNRFSGQDILSVNNRNMRLGVVREDIYKDGQIIKYAGYRRLKIASLDYTNSSGQVMYSTVATSDIKTSTGVLHVLRFDWHEFGFNTSYFVNRAYNSIINKSTTNPV
jgi:hypothetical protein